MQFGIFFLLCWQQSVKLIAVQEVFAVFCDFDAVDATDSLSNQSGMRATQTQAQKNGRCLPNPRHHSVDSVQRGSPKQAQCSGQILLSLKGRNCPDDGTLLCLLLDHSSLEKHTGRQAQKSGQGLTRPLIKAGRSMSMLYYIQAGPCVWVDPGVHQHLTTARSYTSYCHSPGCSRAHTSELWVE